MKPKKTAATGSNKKQAPEKHPADIRAVAKDILDLKFKRGDTLSSCLKQFYAIMRKHGIKQGTPTLNEKGEEYGRTCDNYEWTMCRILFESQLESFFMCENLFGKNIPKDLLQ